MRRHAARTMAKRQAAHGRREEITETDRAKQAPDRHPPRADSEIGLGRAGQHVLLDERKLRVAGFDASLRLADQVEIPQSGEDRLFAGDVRRFGFEVEGAITRPDAAKRRIIDGLGIVNL